MSKAYPQEIENPNGWTKWMRPERNGFRMECCDCGLVHTLQFRLVSGRYIEFRAQRNARATGQVRRHRKT